MLPRRRPATARPPPALPTDAALLLLHPACRDAGRQLVAAFQPVIPFVAQGVASMVAYTAGLAAAQASASFEWLDAHVGCGLHTTLLLRAAPLAVS